MRLAFFLCAAAGVAFAAQSDAFSGMKQADHLRNVRYCEIFLVTRHGFSATADVYNTVGLNDCPERQWQALNVARLKKESGSYKVVLNGPRYFIMDKVALRDPGAERSFDGLNTRLMARLEVKESSSDRVPYAENTVERDSCYVYEKGKNIYELVSAQGRSYIMQSYSREVNERMDEAALPSLGDGLSLPKGWKYRVRNINEDLTVCNSGSEAHVVQDNLRNTYQKLEQ